MEKVKFNDPETKEEVEFFVVEETQINGEKYLLLDNNSFINFETKEKRNFVIDRNKMLLDDMPIVSVFCETKSNNVFSYAGRTIIFKAEDN